jgi:hypothetical protein
VLRSLITAGWSEATYVKGAVVSSGAGVGAGLVTNTVTVPGVLLLLESIVKVVVGLKVCEGIGLSSAVGDTVGLVSSVAVAVGSPVGSGVIVSAGVAVGVVARVGVRPGATVGVTCPSEVVGTTVTVG